MLKIKLSLVLFAFATLLFANDSEYYTSGNHLVPIESDNIELKKEILTLSEISGNSKSYYTFCVDVYYELINSSKTKKSIVAFEAPESYGENYYNEYYTSNIYNLKTLKQKERRAIRSKDKKYKHAYISNFNVEVNGKKIKYKHALLKDLENRGSKGKYNAQIYYFNATLKHGTNIIKHSYKIYSMTSVMRSPEIEYILSTASRWRGGKIGDFRLNINMNHNYFRTNVGFFDNVKNWNLNGGSMKCHKKTEEPFCEYYTPTKKITYHEKGYIPKGAIDLYFPLLIDEEMTELSKKIGYKMH